jgi:predicted O-methyltransferase YrrM
MFFSRNLKYLSYTLLSRHSKGHGIHSPFVYDLVTRVFRNKIDPELVTTVEKIRKRLIADKRAISFEDLGSGSAAGSGESKLKTKRISQIALKSPVTEKYGRFLAKMAAEFGNPLIIELGTSFGISTMYMAAACRNARVITIEGSGEIAQIAKQNFMEAGLSEISVMEGPFDAILPDLIAETKPGLVFIDGNHRKEPVLRYFNMIADISVSNTVVILDDINFSAEMAEAWEEIKRNTKVTATIDIFRMGICFFRQGITPNNYVIRY